MARGARRPAQKQEGKARRPLRGRPLKTGPAAGGGARLPRQSGRDECPGHLRAPPDSKKGRATRE
eukprot:11214270-Lingulodinium_polyedra.AAC.1